MPDVHPWLTDRVFDVKHTISDKLTLNLVQPRFNWPTVLLRTLLVTAEKVEEIAHRDPDLRRQYRHPDAARPHSASAAQLTCR